MIKKLFAGLFFVAVIPAVITFTLTLILSIGGAFTSMSLEGFMDLTQFSETARATIGYFWAALTVLCIVTVIDDK